MKKQILFAIGGTHLASGSQAVLSPDDLPSMKPAAYITKKFSDKEKYSGRSGYRTRFDVGSVDVVAQKRLGELCMRLGGESVRGYSTGNRYLDIYVDDSYQFRAANLVDAIHNLYSKVAALPQKVDDDQYYETSGQIVKESVRDIGLTLVYTVPFDMEAWQSRHQKANETKRDDAETQKQQAESDLKKNEADLAAQKAKNQKALRIVAVAAAVLLAAGVVVLIVKK